MSVIPLIARPIVGRPTELTEFKKRLEREVEA